MELSDWLNGERGRKSALAAHLRVPPSFVIKIAAGTKQVPLDKCPAIQVFTGNQVTCEEMRPDMRDYFASIRSLSGIEQQNPPPALANSAQGAMESVATQPLGA